MQIWHIYHEGEIDKALLMLSKSKIKLAIVVTTKNGERIATASYDAAATQLKNGEIHALLKIDRIFYEKELYFELDFKQLYPEDIKEMAICDQWVSESESPESVLKPGQKVHVTRNDFDTVYDGELTVVTFLDIVVKTADGEISMPASKVKTVVVL